MYIKPKRGREDLPVPPLDECLAYAAVVGILEIVNKRLVESPQVELGAILESERFFVGEGKTNL